MLSLNKFVCGLTAILMLSACASAVFPDFDDNEDDVEVSEGGRVVQNMPKEESSLKADTKNAAYEGEEDADKKLYLGKLSGMDEVLSCLGYKTKMKYGLVKKEEE